MYVGTNGSQLKRRMKVSSSQGYGKPVGSGNGLCIQGEYPGSKSQQQVLYGPAKAVGYAGSYQQSGVLCTPGLAVLRVRVCLGT